MARGEIWSVIGTYLATEEDDTVRIKVTMNQPIREGVTLSLVDGDGVQRRAVVAEVIEFDRASGEYRLRFRPVRYQGSVMMMEAEESAGARKTSRRRA